MRTAITASLGLMLGWVGLFVAVGASCGGSSSSGGMDGSVHTGGAVGSGGIGSSLGGTTSDAPIVGGSPGSDGASSGVGGSTAGSDGPLSTTAGSGGTTATGGTTGSNTSGLPSNGGSSGAGSGGFTGTGMDGGVDSPIVGSEDASTGGTAGSGGAFANGGSGSDASGGSSGGNSGGSDAGGPSFEEYKAPRMVWNGETYSNNGVLTSLTFHSFVRNTGASGTATVTVSYQGYTETTQFAVDSGVQYVLGAKFPITPADDMVHTCALSTVFPGLTLTQNQGNTTVLISNPSYGTCDHVNGPSTSYLIPLSSCVCSGGCNSRFASGCNNPCGLWDDSSGACSSTADSGS